MRFILLLSCYLLLHVSPKLSSSSFPLKILYAFLASTIFSKYITCLVHMLLFLYFICVIILGENIKCEASCFVFITVFISYLFFCPITFLSALFSNALSRCSLSGSDAELQPDIKQCVG